MQLIMKEMLDIYNDQLQIIGTKPRDEVHKYGLKHKVVQCYIIEKTHECTWVYFQQRAWDKDTCPGMYDIACAGHVDAGEDFSYSMKRELSEEVGIKAEDKNLKYAGTKFEYYKKGDCTDDEICEMFILKIEDDKCLKINEELLDMIKAPLDEYEKWAKGETEVLSSYSIINNKKVELDKDNSCPHIKEFNEDLI
ncbi:MAG: NUDIX domain-containing protein, partial [Clostridium sp.]|nr:NUDIX domain-containing protein [Clostridium sp.]